MWPRAVGFGPGAGSFYGRGRAETELCNSAEPWVDSYQSPQQGLNGREGKTELADTVAPYHPDVCTCTHHHTQMDRMIC